MKPISAAPVIRDAVHLEFVGESGHEGTLDAELVYERCDPFAMSVVFQTAPPITWTFSRELLLSGLYEPTGDGDVHVWPCVSTEGVATVLMELTSPDGSVTVQLGLRECHDFIDKMLRVAPLGQELDAVDLDSAFARLLDDSPDLSV